MSKLDGRIKTLVRRTHGFVSHNDLCVIRDWYEAQFDEEEKPEDLDEKHLELHRLNEKMSQGNDPAIEARLTEVLQSSAALWFKAMIPFAVKMCDNYPNGSWIEYPTFRYYQRDRKAGREYFAQKKDSKEQC